VRAVSEQQWRALVAEPGAQARHQAAQILLRARGAWEWSVPDTLWLCRWAQAVLAGPRVLLLAAQVDDLVAALDQAISEQDFTTKNRKGRTFVMTLALRACLEGARERVRAIERQHGRIIPQVLPHDDGRPIKNFRKSWETACRRAGCRGRSPTTSGERPSGISSAQTSRARSPWP
jgi:hypothetical protein